MKEEIIKKKVREGYAKIAKNKGIYCCPQCSDVDTSKISGEISRKIGYAEEELSSVPEDANLGLGCGNPVALASLKEGEAVLDLGSGAGLDCFLASKKVGVKGKVIGVDMTPEMIDKGRENARKGNYENVEFRLGEIENLPVADNTIDIVISNCVINLSTDKKRVFEETFRALKHGGRLLISDIVLLKELSKDIRESVEAYVGCLSGAIMEKEYIKTIKNVGFQDVKIVKKAKFPIDCMINDPTAKAIIEKTDMPIAELKKTASSVASITLHAIKPAN